MLVNLLKSSILKAVVGFCFVLQESEEQRSRELHFLCEQVPKECPSIGRNFIPFSTIGKNVYFAGSFHEKFRHFFFFCNKYKIEHSLWENLLSFLANRCFYKWVLSQLKITFLQWDRRGWGWGWGWLQFKKVWIFCGRGWKWFPRLHCLCFKLNSSSQIGYFSAASKVRRTGTRDPGSFISRSAHHTRFHVR